MADPNVSHLGEPDHTPNGPSESATQERLTAVQCLRNAHGHIAQAYAQIDGSGMGPGHRARMIKETLDAVDWIRRALEHMQKVGV